MYTFAYIVTLLCCCLTLQYWMKVLSSTSPIIFQFASPPSADDCNLGISIRHFLDCVLIVILTLCQDWGLNPGCLFKRSACLSPHHYPLSVVLTKFRCTVEFSEKYLNDCKICGINRAALLFCSSIFLFLQVVYTTSQTIDSFLLDLISLA